MAAHYPKLRLEWWSARIDLPCFFLSFFPSLRSSAFSPMFRHCSSVHLHPGSRWSWQRLILFVFFCVCLDGSQSDGIQFYPFDKKTCIWGKTTHKAPLWDWLQRVAIAMRPQISTRPVKKHNSSSVLQQDGRELVKEAESICERSQSRPQSTCTRPLWHCLLPDWQRKRRTDVECERYVSPFLMCSHVLRRWRLGGAARPPPNVEVINIIAALWIPRRFGFGGCGVGGQGGRIHQEALI